MPISEESIHLDYFLLFRNKPSSGSKINLWNVVYMFCSPQLCQEMSFPAYLLFPIYCLHSQISVTVIDKIPCLQLWFVSSSHIFVSICINYFDVTERQITSASFLGLPPFDKWVYVSEYPGELELEQQCITFEAKQQSCWPS